MNDEFWVSFGAKKAVLNISIPEDKKELFINMLPQLLDRVRREVMYEMAHNNELQMYWAKHIFNTTALPPERKKGIVKNYF